MRRSQAVATRREILSLYGVSFSGGPMSSVVIIFLQLMIAKQAKYLASQGSDGEDWILWKEKFADGPLCGDAGLPHPKDSPNAYDRPKGYSEECKWFPKSSVVPGLGLHYTSTIVYGTTGILLITGVSLLMFGPFGDYSRYRRQMLAFCYVVWVPAFLAVSLVSKPELYWLALVFALLGATTYLFGLKSPFAAYLPLLIENSHELCEWRGFMENRKQAEGGYSQQAEIGIVELPRPRHEKEDLVGAASAPHDSGDGQGRMGDNEHVSDLAKRESMGIAPFLEFPDSASSDERHALRPGTVRSDGENDTAESMKENYQKAYQSVAGKIALRESASFISGQLLGLAFQAVVILVYSAVTGSQDNPKDTMGERMAIAFAAIWGAFFGTIGIMGLKDRAGPPFPEGRKLLIGTIRSVNTLKLMSQKLPNLLKLMVFRMIFWLSIQTLLTMSTLFFEKEFGMEARELIFPLVLYLVVGIPSAIATSVLVQYWAGKTLLIFKFFAIGVIFVPFYMLIGVRMREEVYVLMSVSAFLVAPFPALVRAMMADMIPDGYTTTIMSFEGLLENCTTWMGPLIVGSVLNLSGSMRWGVFSMVSFFFIGLPLIFWVDIKAAGNERVAFEQWSSEKEVQPQFNPGTGSM